MKLEWRLKQLLAEHHLDQYGVETRIARDCGVHRHTIGKFLRNQVQSPKLEVLEKICDWLIEKGVSADSLPGALFGKRPSKLWRAIGHSNEIHIFLGEYHLKGAMSTTPQASPPLSVARHDAAVATKIIHFLSTDPEFRDTRPSVKTLYVPFSVFPVAEESGGDGFIEDKERAGRIFSKMRESPRGGRAVILIGSQRGNYLVEHLVADLFNCDPFVPAQGEVKVPVYLRYRPFDRQVPSCFGGLENPVGKSSDIRHGTYFLDENFEWQLFEWKKKKQDAGIVIIIREPDSVEMAAFGFSGRATNAVGNALVQKSEQFWPDEHAKTSDTVKVGAKEIGIYLCVVEFCGENSKVKDGAYENFENDTVKVFALSRKVLKKFLNKG